jgi:uncharacterized protein (TIGR02145 family)
LKSVEGWDEWEDKYGKIQNGNGDNSSGFNGLPGGCRLFDGSFYYISSDAFFWSATESDDNYAWYRNLYNDGSLVARNGYYESVGASVRCLRD